MLENLYENIGGKIKLLAKVIFVVEAIAAIIGGFALMSEDEEMIPVGLLMLFVGPIIAWVSSWVLYAFGEISEDLHAVKSKYVKAEKTNATVEIPQVIEETELSTNKILQTTNQEVIPILLKNGKYECPKCGCKITKGQETCLCFRKIIWETNNSATDEEVIYEQHICSTEEELKVYIENVLDEKSRPKELLDLYWQYKKYIYGIYPEKEVKQALEKVISKCEKNTYEGNSQLMIAVAKNKISTL